MPTKQAKAPKLNREILKGLLLEHVKPRLIPWAEQCMPIDYENQEADAYGVKFDVNVLRIEKMVVSKKVDNWGWKYLLIIEYCKGYFIRVKVGSNGKIGSFYS